MRPTVLDASVALAWCFEDETTDYTDQILDYVRHNGALVPSLWLSEITNGLVQAIKRKRIDSEGSLAFLEKISSLPIQVAQISSKEHLSQVFQLSIDVGLTSYDAAYLYLAIREKIGLATTDKALRLAGRRHRLPKLG